MCHVYFILVQKISKIRSAIKYQESNFSLETAYLEIEKRKKNIHKSILLEIFPKKQVSYFPLNVLDFSSQSKTARHIQFKYEVSIFT